jgi:hypothetical protein
MAIVAGAILAFTVPTGGCSSKSDNKQPVYNGPEDPNLKRATRGIGGEPAKPAAPRAPVSKN